MKFDKLLEIEKDALTNPNYQYKDMSQADRLEMAKKSFKRLTTSDAELVYTSWKKFCEAEKVPFDFDQAIWFRFLAQTNLFYLCNLLEKYRDITPECHEDICNKFFVQKDPTVPTFRDFTSAYTELKERLLLVPRGGFKSSIDIADSVQWIIAFPEVTILILTGVYKLANDFVGELREHFMKISIGEKLWGPRIMNDGSTSAFQVLFPEHTVVPTEGSSLEFQTPACKAPDKEPTVMAASIEQSLSGWHFCIVKADDVVTNENSQTLTRLQTVERQLSINKAMLHPFGFFDKIGTWYHELDIYGIDIKRAEDLEKDGESPDTIIYLKACWWPNEAAIKSGKIEEEMVETDWVLWFPKDRSGIERLSYKFLKRELRKNPEMFAIKYLNDPRKVNQVKFPHELLMRRTIPANQLPPNGMIIQTWDTAYSTQSWADYTVGITSLIYGGRFYIIDCVRGRYNDVELPQMIATTAYKWKPKRIAVEDSNGVRWMSREIRREMDKLSISIPVEFVPLGNGKGSRSKEIKAKPVLRLLGDERLYFINSCACLEEMFQELEGFPNKTHDDVVSGLSILVEQFCAYADMDARINFVNSDFASDQKSKAMHDRVYCDGYYSKYNQNFALTEDNLSDMSSQESLPQERSITDIDPLSELI